MRDKAYWKWKNPPKDYTEEDYVHLGMQAVAVKRLNQAVANGTLARLDVCEVCGVAGPTVAHHWNGYERPFDVWWVCRSCNANLPHDERIALAEAQERMKGRRQERWRSILDAHREYMRWKEPCGVCGVWTALWLMDEWDGLLLCQYCSPER